MSELAALRTLALLLRPAPLLLVAIFSLLLAIGVEAGLWGLPMVVIVGSWFFKYAFMLLDHVAEGRPGAPVLTIEVANPAGEMRPVSYALVAAAYYAGTGALRAWVGPGAVSALRMAAVAVVPAVMAAQVITGSLARALHPVTIVATLRGLGAGYPLVLGAALLGSMAGRVLLQHAGQLAVTILVAALMLLWLAAFAVLGGIIHARRSQLGFEPEHSPERARERQRADLERRRDRFIDQVFAEYRAGRLAQAWQSIEQYASRGENRMDEYRWIHDRVAGWSNPRLANRVAQELLPLLLASRRTGEALRLVRARLAEDPGFRPAAAEHILQLAGLARDGGDRPLARILLADFDARCADEAALARARRMRGEMGG